MGGRIGERLIESSGMSAPRLVTRLLASFLVASLVAACSSDPSASQSSTPASLGPTPSPSPRVLTDLPSGFPTAWTNTVDPGPALYTPVEGGLSREYTGTLRAAEGTSGTYVATILENRVPVAEIMCAGVTYRDVYTSEDPVVTLEVEFPGWGHAVLVATGRVVVFSSLRNASSPAVCDELTGGTYEFEFTDRPIRQMKSGAWRQDASGLLVFDPPVEPSASPSESPG